MVLEKRERKNYAVAVCVMACNEKQYLTTIGRLIHLKNSLKVILTDARAAPQEMPPKFH